ncbi:MAG: M20/M25/M40 family metallo-hydrolase [Bacteroidia bacterium]
MKYFFIVALFVSTQVNSQINKEDSLFIRTIFDAALTNSKCYEVLEHLCTQIGPRLSGSVGAAKAVDFMAKTSKEEGFDKTIKQEVMVPHWVRGNICKVETADKVKEFKACALGGSVGGDVTAGIIRVNQVDDLDSLGEENIKGKIVFFTRPMEPRHIHTFHAYGGCVDQRWAGPSKAAKYGAKATLVRSMSLKEDEFPHTGSMSYDTLYPKIPAFALSTASATNLTMLLDKTPDLQIHLVGNSMMLPDTLSHNVVAETVGSEFPNNYIITGGHLDAWDNGQGAHDDGAGCVQSLEALRILKNLGYKPKNSLRAVLFMNEENGLRGGKMYAELAEKNQEKHIAAIESDRGGFTPRGFYIDTKNEALINFIASYRALLEPYGLHDFKEGGGGADIGPLKKSGTLCLGYIPDSQRYFDYHHAGSDTFDAVNKRELELGAASIAAMIYLIDKYGLPQQQP